jgi:rhamnose utilization protein RhaD (predicted bifunctional aldolase and dehydrogenase)
VDHLHPDSGIALAAAADGEKLTRQCFGDRVAWVPWRRPGFQLGLDIAAIAAASPQAIGVVLGGHGITAWGATSAECEARSLEIIRAAAEFIEANGSQTRSARSSRATSRCPKPAGAPARPSWPR